MCFIGEMMTDQWMQRDTEVYSEKAKGVKGAKGPKLWGAAWVRLTLGIWG